MSEAVIDSSQALQIARAFNLAFNNAFMYGGSHQSTRDSASSFFHVLRPILEFSDIITISCEKGSVYVENHCVDKLVSVQRISSRFTKTSLQSISFDSSASLESAQTLFYLLGTPTDFHDADAMQTYLKSRHIYGVKINYVVYQKVTVDDAVVSREMLQEARQLLDKQSAGFHMQPDQESLVRELSGVVSLQHALHESEASGVGDTDPAVPRTDYDSFIASQIRSINSQISSLDSPAEQPAFTPEEMLETVYRLKENVLENIRLQKETGRLLATDELAINEINMLSYKVIVKLIKDEYRNDRSISVKRLAQIIRRMLPDIRELKFLLPQLKEGLFAEGMPPSEYLSLVKELRKELDSDELIQIMADASDQIGLTLNELLDGIREAPEEAARLIVMAAEIKRGGVRADDRQMSAVLSEYIERVSRDLALQSPEASAPGGGTMLKAAVTRIERELLERLKTQDVSQELVSETAARLASQFSETVSRLKHDWVKNSMAGPEKLDEATMLAIIEQIAEQGQEFDGVTGEIRSILISNGIPDEKINDVIQKARLRAQAAVTHKIVIPDGTYAAPTMAFFMDQEIRRNSRYNSPFSTILVSYEKIVDLRTFSMIELTADINIQLTNQALTLLKELKRDLDVVGIFSINSISIPMIILPMTEMNGALFVKKRIEKELPCHEFLVNGITVHVEPVVTASSFDRNMTPDKAAYARSIYHLHCQPKLQ